MLKTAPSRAGEGQDANSTNAAQDSAVNEFQQARLQVAARSAALGYRAAILLRLEQRMLRRLGLARGLQLGAPQLAQALPTEGMAVNDQGIADARHYSAAIASTGGVRSTGGNQRLSFNRCSAASAMACFFMVARFSAASLETPSRTASRMRSLETRPR